MNDPIVKAIMVEFRSPERLAAWSLGAMAELGKSISRDLEEKQLFAFLTRLRQPEELYIRTLYTLFIAEQDELPHIASGARPNDLASIYTQVNKHILGTRGTLLVAQPGLREGTFKPIDVLNEGTHVTFRAIFTHYGWKQNPQQVPSIDTYGNYILRYCKSLKRMSEMFKAGEDLRASWRQAHTPRSFH